VGDKFFNIKLKFALQPCNPRNGNWVVLFWEQILEIQLNGLKIKYVYKDSSFTCSSQISLGSSSHRLLDHLFKISFLAKWLENKNFSTD
jgi:hypothetical protein